MNLKTVMRNEPAKVGLRELCNDIKNYIGNKNIIFVEIGSYMGESAEVFAKELPEATIYCVDPWQSGYDNKDSASHSDFKDVEEQFDLRTARYKNINKIKDYSTSVTIPCNAIYIDGIHTYEGVKQDIEHWIEQLKPGKKVISGHDYYEDSEILRVHPHVVGVKKAVDELLGKPDKLYSDGSWIKYL